MQVVFYGASAIALLSTILVITGKNAVHALLYMITSLLAVALIFFTLGAPLVAALEVILYAGAIMVLFVFVVMMLNLGEAASERERAWLHPRAWWGPGVLAALMIAELIYAIARGELPIPRGTSVGPREISLALFGPYALAVEMASMLLLAGLVGAYHLARREEAE
jgi:NADH-quinone oxidoreductase subunit J